MQHPPVPKTVLLVEDEEAAQYIFTTILESAGYRTVLATSLDSVMALIAERTPDLVVMDIGLPGAVSGVEITRRLRQDARTRDVPIVVVTVYAFEEDARLAREAGCTSFITKPVEPTLLAAEVQRLIGPAAGPTGA